MLSWQISICFIFILGSQFLLPQRSNSEKREKSNSRTEWDRGFSVPGAFKLDQMQPFKPILFWQFSICFTFILGGQFLLPQRANSEKGAISQLQKWTEQELFECLGPLNWTICSPFNPFGYGNFQFVSSLYWQANTYHPRGLIVRKGIFSNFKTEWDRGFSAWGIQTGPFAAL